MGCPLPSEEGATLKVIRTLTCKPRPEIGPDCLVCAELILAAMAATAMTVFGRGTSLRRKRTLVGPYSRPMPRALR